MRIFKGNIPNSLYLIHFFLIILLWFLFFIFFFFDIPNLNFSIPNLFFYFFLLFGIFFYVLGFYFLRKGSLVEEEHKIFKFSKKGDLFLISGFIILFITFFLKRNPNLYLSLILGTLVILQTHFPLIEDESLYPEELKNGNFNG